MAEATTLSATAAAFDLAAAGYDRGFGRNPSGRVFRYVFQERLLKLFAPGSRLLDLGCGSGEDALFLAWRGYEVVGVDVAPGMLERARAKAAQSPRVRFELCPAEEVDRLPGAFDGAYSDFGALNCADLGAVGRALARALRPGAPLALSLMGPWPLPLLLSSLLTGRGRLPGAQEPRVEGIAVPADYPRPAAVRRAFGPEFAWSSGFALGALLPSPAHPGWAERHAQAFGLLAAAESIVRGWPLLRTLGDHNVLLGRRL